MSIYVFFIIFKVFYLYNYCIFVAKNDKSIKNSASKSTTTPKKTTKKGNNTPKYKNSSQKQFQKAVHKTFGINIK